ncbi:efflux RND transporter periplasmic adaptor subunit [Burkholderia plantarii]|uniref:Multidrug resistance protein MdtA n=1 Tax=Burkholderia plantarii TaxID=41899 RepID=A0A0B6RZ58_BURPL|nr:efflux RND transporter periplasmic adaptor subunit [Burkholderia plantarii]AJK48688.1 multidrug resistance protein MdtA [Burkholderia plantarii]
MKKWFVWFGILIAVLAVAVVARRLHRIDLARHEASATASAATPVGAVTVRVADVPVYVDALGTVTPTRTIIVVPQVSGVLESVEMGEGQTVRKGQVIAHIDSRALEAQLQQARGTLAHDEALLANARADLQRYRALIDAGSITRQTLDTQAATVREAQGTVQADAGSVRNLEVQLGYCTIRSPVDGAIGLRTVDPGNYVTSANASGIAVITQLQPATVVYAVPEDTLGAIRRAMAAGPVPVLAYDRDRHTLLARGALLAVDNLVNTSTGTINVKARFAESGEALYPNQFVNTRMRVDTLARVPVVPSVAIQHGSNGDFVFALDAADHARLRRIKAGPALGDETAIVDGLKAGERVVTEGADRLDDGSPVTVAAH